MPLNFSATFIYRQILLQWKYIVYGFKQPPFPIGVCLAASQAAKYNAYSLNVVGLWYKIYCFDIFSCRSVMLTRTQPQSKLTYVIFYTFHLLILLRARRQNHLLQNPQRKSSMMSSLSTYEKQLTASIYHATSRLLN